MGDILSRMKHKLKCVSGRGVRPIQNQSFSNYMLNDF